MRYKAKPVSYTHLDVYKRQGNDSMVVIFNGCIVIFLNHALFDQLDVYKRQHTERVPRSFLR